MEKDSYEFDPYFNWSDHEEIAKMHEKHSSQKMEIFKKMHDAKKNGDEKELVKLKRALLKHEIKGEEYKEKAEAAYYHWF